MGTILVTGATGFIGGSIARRLLGRGHNVIALVRSPAAAAELESAGVELRRGDITDAASVRAACEGAEAAVHCAALASDWAPWEKFVEMNTNGAKNVFEAALDAKLSRVVHFSTTDVLGFRKDGKPVGDSAPLKKTGFPYPDTKIEAEKIAFELHRTRGLPVVAIRPAWVYGPGDRTFIPEIVHAMRTRQMVFFGNPRNIMTINYIDNLVDAVLLALEKENAVGRAYLVSDDAEISWARLTTVLANELGLTKPRITIPFPAAQAAATAAELIAKALKSKKRPVMTRYALEVTGRNMRYDIGRIKSELGFEPRISTEEGLRRTIEWLKSADLNNIKKK